MFRNLLIALVFCSVVAGAAYFGGTQYIDGSVRRKLALLPQHAEEYSLRLSNVGYEDLILSPPREIRFRNLRAGFRISGEASPEEHDKLNFRADHLSVIASDLGYRDLTITLSGVKIRSADGGRSDLGVSGFYDSKPYGIDCDSISAALSVDPQNPRDAVVEFFDKLGSLPKTGYSSVPIKVSCNMVYQLRNSLLSAPLQVVESQGRWHVRPEAEALRKASAQLELRPGKAELELMAGNVLAAPAILQMRETADAFSRVASSEDKTVQRKVYANVMLGYFLGRRFPPRFTDSLISAIAKDLPDGESRIQQRMLQVGRQLSSKVRSEAEIREVAARGDVARQGSATYTIR